MILLLLVYSLSTIGLYMKLKELEDLIKSVPDLTAMVLKYEKGQDENE